MIALSQFNGLSKDEAVGLLVPCVAIPAWGETLVNLRPFASRHALLQTAREAMDYWGEDELNAALSAHPRIGEKPTGGQAHAGCRARSSRRWTARMSGSHRPCRRAMPATSPFWPGVFNPRQRAQRRSDFTGADAPTAAYRRRRSD